MSEVKTWDEINASPLLQLSPEERVRLHQAHDERFHAFWGDCFSTALDSRTEKEKEKDLDSEAFSIAFLAAFDRWEPKPGQNFSDYLQTAVRNAQKRMDQEDKETASIFKRETNRKIRKALDWIVSCGIPEGKVYNNRDLEKVVAESAGVHPDTLHEALRNQLTLLSLDDSNDEESTLEQKIADKTEDVKKQVELPEKLLPWLHNGIAMMSLEKKERYGRKNGALWSSRIMGYLRNEDKNLPETEIPYRMNRCDDLRPLEQDNCLWDILLLHRYVEFTVCPPYEPEALEHAALNELKSAALNPSWDKTVAAFRGVTKEAISGQRKTWTKRIREMQEEAKEKAKE